MDETQIAAIQASLASSLSPEEQTLLRNAQPLLSFAEPTAVALAGQLHINWTRFALYSRAAQLRILRHEFAHLLRDAGEAGARASQAIPMMQGFMTARHKIQTAQRARLTEAWKAVLGEDLWANVNAKVVQAG